MANENEVIGWDDEVSDKGIENNREGGSEELVLLQPGQYRFVVNKVEKGRYNGGANLPACGMVKVGVVLYGDEGHGYASTRFYMVKKCLWGIYSFLESIGLHTPGQEQAVIPWNKVVKGLEGKCSVKIRSYNGKDYNEVDRWIPKASDSAKDDDGDY